MIKYISKNYITVVLAVEFKQQFEPNQRAIQPQHPSEILCNY